MYEYKVAQLNQMQNGNDLCNNHIFIFTCEIYDNTLYSCSTQTFILSSLGQEEGFKSNSGSYRKQNEENSEVR